ncbi:MAG: hypothetical protein QW815_06145 [Nitrososphaerota archaeon]
MDSLGIETEGPQLGTKRGTSFTDPRNGKIFYAKKDVYCLYAPSDYRLKLYKQIGFTIRRKQQRLEDYLTRRGLLAGLQPNTPLYFSLFQFLL